MANTVTVTAKTGPGQTVTAKVISYILLTIDPIRQVLHVTDSNGQVQDFDINAVTALTCTVSGAAGTYAFTIS